MDVNITGFIPALLPVALSPGASFTLAMNSALVGGRGGLVRTLAGTALGIYTHALLIGLGVTALLIASPSIFFVLKIAGTAYLIWLGAQLVRSGLKTQRPEINSNVAAVTLKQAWLVNVLNPKAVIFYLTVVSQFAGHQASVGSYLTLASLHVVVMGLWLFMISNVLVFTAKKANPLTLKKYINTVGGLVLIIFSLWGLSEFYHSR